MGKVMLISCSPAFITCREVKMSLHLSNEALPPEYMWVSGGIMPFFFNLLQSSLSLDNRMFTYDIYIHRFWGSSCYFRWSELYIYSRCVSALPSYGIISQKARRHKKTLKQPLYASLSSIPPLTSPLMPHLFSMECQYLNQTTFHFK